MILAQHRITCQSFGGQEADYCAGVLNGCLRLYPQSIDLFRHQIWPKILKEKNIIDDKTYCRFLHLSEGAKTPDQLDKIDDDLTEKSATEVFERLIEERFVGL